MYKVQHFTERELKIISFFYVERKGHVRKIKKSIRISERTLIKYLALLEKKHILKFEREGNLKIYHINVENPVTKILFSYFDIERFEKLEYVRKKAILDFLKQLKKIKIPYFILLFGSTAKENYTKKSDVDIIISYENFDKQNDNNLKEITKKILAETGIKINYILIKLEEFIKEKENKENYALQDAIKYGYPVMGNQTYYEVIL